jgi:hypothetical protein
VLLNGPFISGFIVGGALGFIACAFAWVVFGLWRGSYWDRADIEAKLRAMYGLPTIREASEGWEEAERAADRKHLAMLQ